MSGGPLKKPVLACDGLRHTKRPNQASPPSRDVNDNYEPQQGQSRRNSCQLFASPCRDLGAGSVHAVTRPASGPKEYALTPSGER